MGAGRGIRKPPTPPRSSVQPSKGIGMVKGIGQAALQASKDEQRGAVKNTLIKNTANKQKKQGSGPTPKPPERGEANIMPIGQAVAQKPIVSTPTSPKDDYVDKRKVDMARRGQVTRNEDGNLVPKRDQIGNVVPPRTEQRNASKNIMRKGRTKGARK